MELPEFKKRLEELNLRFTLEGIDNFDRDTFVKMHGDVVLERIARLISQNDQLHQYANIIFLSAFADHSFHLQPESIVDDTDQFLFGQLPLSDFIDRLKRAKLEQRQHKTVISFGVLSLDARSRISFAEIIPSGINIPIKGCYQKSFRLSEDRQRFARIPLCYRLDTGYPERMDAVELRLPPNLTIATPCRITLEPRPEGIVVTLESDNYRKEAILEFDDSPLKHAQESIPLLPEELANRALHLVNRCLELLSTAGSALDREMIQQIKKSLLSICETLLSSDEEEWRKSYQSLLQNLQEAGPLAEGFFAYKAIENLSANLEVTDRESNITTAASFLSNLYDAAYKEDSNEQGQSARDLSALALGLMVDAIRTEAMEANEEISEFLGISPGSLDGLKERLLIFGIPADNLVDELERFLSSPASAGMSAHSRDLMSEDVRRMDELRDDKEALQQAYEQLIRDIEDSNSLVKGFLAYRLIENLSANLEATDSEANLAVAKSLLKDLAQQEEAEGRRRIVETFFASVLDLIVKHLSSGNEEQIKKAEAILGGERPLEWLTVMMGQTDDPARMITQFLDSPLSIKLPTDTRDKLREDAQRIEELSDAKEWRRLQVSLLAKGLENFTSLKPPLSKKQQWAQMADLRERTEIKRYLLRQVEE